MSTKASAPPLTTNGHATKSIRSPKPTTKNAASVNATGGSTTRGRRNSAKESSGEAEEEFTKKVKRVRYGCQMPESEFAALKELKNRLAALNVHAKKSELVRAGLLLLAALPERRLQNAVAKIIKQDATDKK